MTQEEIIDIDDYGDSSESNIVKNEPSVDMFNSGIAKNNFNSSMNYDLNNTNNSVLSIPDDENKFNNKVSTNSSFDVFNNFDFLDVSSPVERKSNDVEILDFDD